MLENARINQKLRISFFIIIFIVFFLIGFFNPLKISAIDCWGTCESDCYNPNTNSTYKCNAYTVTASSGCSTTVSCSSLLTCPSGGSITASGEYGVPCSSPPSCSAPLRTSYVCNPTSGCYGITKCPDDGIVSYSSCVANCAAESPPNPPPVSNCAWDSGGQKQCVCRPKEPNEIGNNQYCSLDGDTGWVPSGCSWDGSRCCCNTSSPPPPTKYYCSRNICEYNSANKQDGKYSGDANCQGKCGIKCTLTRIDGTKQYSGSSKLLTNSTYKTVLTNTGSCNGANGTVDMVRSLTSNPTNTTSNPARFRVDCTAEEYKPANVTRNWKINNIKYAGQDIYTNPSGTGVIVTNQPAEILPGLSTNLGNTPGSTTTRTLLGQLKVDYSIEPKAIAGINCDGYLALTKLGSIEGTDTYDEYTFKCSKFNTDLSKTVVYNQNLLRDAIVSTLNGPTYFTTTISKWGEFAKNPDNSIKSNTTNTVVVSDVLTTTPGAGCSIPCVNDQFSVKLTFKVRQNSYTLPNNPTGVVCLNMRPLRSEAGGGYYQIFCTTSNPSVTDADFTRSIKTVIAGTGYEPTGPNTVVDNTPAIYNAGCGCYGFYDNRFIVGSTIARLQNVNATIDDPTAAANSFSAQFEVWFKDGIQYGNKDLSINVTDGYGPAETKTLVQTIDTALPTITRSIAVQTMNKFNMTSLASDDYALRNHYYYIGPAKFTLAPNNNPPATTLYISQHRNNTYLDDNQIAKISPVTPVNDFTTLDLKSTNYTGDARYGGVLDSGTYTAPIFFWFKRLFATSLVNPPTNTKTDTRTAQYELDVDKLKNQKEPYEIKFGSGNDSVSNGGFGRWFAEDHFCNAQGNASQIMSVGSPWLQTESGNVFVKGTSDGTGNSDYKSLNMSIYNIDDGNSCQVTSNSFAVNQRDNLNFCPEKLDDYASTYLTQSTVSQIGQMGPRQDRRSKTDLTSVAYKHGMTKISDFFDNAAGAFEHFTSIVDNVVSDGDPLNPINVNCTSGTGPLPERVVTVGATNINATIINGTSSYNLLQNMQSSPSVCTDQNGIVVVKVNGNLNINSLVQPNAISPNTGVRDASNIGGNNTSWPHWYVSSNTVFLVDGNVSIQPDIRKDLNGSGAKSLVIIASGNIEIKEGTYKSYQNNLPTDYPYYDRVDAFLIADGQIRTLADKGIVVGSNTVKVYDGLQVVGGLLQLGKINSTFVTCKSPNNINIDDLDNGNPGSSIPCFGRDLILMHNFVAPAETVQYDPIIESIFNPVLGEYNTLYSIREVKTKTGTE